MSYKVKLRTFEGPFDLLVYLIENSQVDIYDISISEITYQYLEYLTAMEELDVAIGSEFLVLAAQLIDIKTRMLLPRKTDESGNVVEEDPRSELIERLLEYKKFKRGAVVLEDMGEYASCIFEKPQEDITEYLDSPDEVLSLDMNQFVSAFNLFIEKKQRVEAVRKRYVKVQRQRESTESRMKYIMDLFEKQKTDKISFRDTIINENDKYDIVLSFTSLLEMIKGRNISAKQETMYGDIILTVLEEEDDKQEIN